jgi:hypothetical protein
LRLKPKVDGRFIDRGKFNGTIITDRKTFLAKDFLGSIKFASMCVEELTPPEAPLIWKSIPKTRAVETPKEFSMKPELVGGIGISTCRWHPVTEKIRPENRKRNTLVIISPIELFNHRSDILLFALQVYLFLRFWIKKDRGHRYGCNPWSPEVNLQAKFPLTIPQSEQKCQI